jgi:hypothetical protein
MRIRGLVIVLCALLALGPLACSGDDDEGPAAEGTTTAPTTGASGETTSTGASEQPATTTQASPATADPAVIADAAGKTAEQGSARIATNVRIATPGVGQDRFSGEGAFDFQRRAGQMTLQLIEGQGAGTAAGESKAIFVDSTIYYQLQPGVLGGNRRWLKLELQNVADASGVDFGPLVQGSQADPSQYLLWLRALGPGVTKIGEEEVRGVPTDRYRAAVDLKLLESQAPPGKEAEWSAYVQALRDRLGLEFIPVEVWIDNDGLVRRLYHEYGFSAEGTMSAVTTELFDFGVDVNAKAPPAGQVAALEDFIRP